MSGSRDGLVDRGTMSSYSSLLHHLPLFKMLTKTDPYRRRIKTEKKAKIVAAVLGTELIQFLAALAILHLDYLEKGMN